MLNLNVDVLKEVWTEQKRFLRDGLRHGDIWDRQTGLSLSDYEAAPEVTALFNRLLDEIDATLSGSGFPKLHRYMLLNLQEGVVLLINHGEGIIQGLELDPKRINLGLLFNVAIPKAIAKIQSARQEG